MSILSIHLINNNNIYRHKVIRGLSEHYVRKKRSMRISEGVYRYNSLIHTVFNISDDYIYTLKEGCNKEYKLKHGYYDSKRRKRKNKLSNAYDIHNKRLKSAFDIFSF